MQLADHLFQFIVLEGFFCDIPKGYNIKEIYFKNFNEGEFVGDANNLNVLKMLNLDGNGPNMSI